MLKTYDATSQAFIVRNNVKRYNATAQAWQQIESAKTYDATSQAWIERFIKQFTAIAITGDFTGNTLRLVCTSDGNNRVKITPQASTTSVTFTIEDTFISPTIEMEGSFGTSDPVTGTNRFSHEMLIWTVVGYRNDNVIDTFYLLVGSDYATQNPTAQLQASIPASSTHTYDKLVFQILCIVPTANPVSSYGWAETNTKIKVNGISYYDIRDISE